MAIFDQASFDPQSYQGGMSGWLLQALQSGLLGRSLGGQGQQQSDQTQFPPMQPQTGPTFANGNQGMMGGVPFPIAPGGDSAQLPPNAQPTGPAQSQQQPPQGSGQPMPPQMQQPQPNNLPLALQGAGGGNLGAGAMGFLNAGSPLQAIGNLVQGLATGQRSDPQGMMLQQVQATYQALVKSGVPDPVAQAAALNPEVMKTIAPQLTGGQLQNVGKDPTSGQDMFKVWNPATKTMSPVNEVGGASGAGAVGTPSFPAVQAAAAKGESGAALYKYMQPSDAETVKSIIEGRIPITSQALRSPALIGPIRMAQLVDPTLDLSENGVRAAAMQSARSGEMADSQKASNQAVHHITTMLVPAMKALNNSQSPALNIVTNAIGEHVLGHQAQTNFFPVASAVADEVAKVYNKGQLSDTQIKAWKEGLSPNMSKEQFAGQIPTLIGLLQGGLDAQQEKRKQAIGTVNDAKMGPILTPGSQKEIASVLDWARQNGADPKLVSSVEERLSGNAQPGQAAPQATGLPNGWSVKVH